MSGLSVRKMSIIWRLSTRCSQSLFSLFWTVKWLYVPGVRREWEHERSTVWSGAKLRSPRIIIRVLCLRSFSTSRMSSSAHTVYSCAVFSVVAGAVGAYTLNTVRNLALLVVFSFEAPNLRI